MKPRIVVAEDVPALLEALVSFLEDAFEIVATAADGPSALEAIEMHEPDVAVLDISMPGLTGLEVMRAALKAQPNLAVVICSVNRDPSVIQSAADAGARGYVVKADVVRNLVKAVNAVASGGTFFHTVGGTAIFCAGVLQLLC